MCSDRHFAPSSILHPTCNMVGIVLYGGLAQLVRASALHAEGRRFDSDILHGLFYGVLVQ